MVLTIGIFSLVQTALLNAAERLEKRVIPLFSGLERVRDENSLLRQELAVYRSDIQSKKGLAARIEQMNHAITDQNQTLLSVGDELAREKKKRSSEEKANHRLVHSLRKKQEEMKVKEREIESLRSVIEERDKQVRKLLFFFCLAIDVYVPQLHLQKRKLRELAKRLKPAPVVQDVNDSLVVEPPLSVSDRPSLFENISYSQLKGYWE
jgi:septal ring factor EnvC (AmiA/AmiB activator)